MRDNMRRTFVSRPCMPQEECHFRIPRPLNNRIANNRPKARFVRQRVNCTRSRLKKTRKSIESPTLIRHDGDSATQKARRFIFPVARKSTVRGNSLQVHDVDGTSGNRISENTDLCSCHRP